MLYCPPQGIALHALNREARLGIRTRDVDLVGRFHELFHRCHALVHFVVVHCADVEVEVFESFGAHLRKLRHCGVRPAQHNPLCLVDAPVHRLLHCGGDFRHSVLRNVGVFEYVVRAAYCDVRVHLFHFVERAVRRDSQPVAARRHREPAGYARVAEFDVSESPARRNFVYEGFLPFRPGVSQRSSRTCSPCLIFAECPHKFFASFI